MDQEHEVRTTDLKMTTLESWVQDLTMQNAMLVHTVELLEHEASERVLLLQKRLQESSKSALKYMTKVQDYDSQMQEATGEKIRSQSQQILSLSQLPNSAVVFKLGMSKNHVFHSATSKLGGAIDR
uniref:Uncharacterized protein n=1 Tax=Timema tahoe TaxID=61484 RepID=A0A7R9P0H3_9NEOP|nr:unnamed protein product [Timema tahoe]